MPVVQVRSETEFAGVMSKQRDKLIIVDFTAKWCGPCQQIAPFFEKLSDKYRGGCLFLKVDVDEVPDVASSSGVKAMPTFVFIKEQCEVGRLQGANPEALEQKIKDLKPPTAFGGGGESQGHRLGGPDLPGGKSAIPVPTDEHEENEMIAQASMDIDDERPTTRINVRLADGSKFTVRLNTSDPVTKIREFICIARPDQANQIFVLMTTFPNKEITNEDQSIQACDLLNAVLVQKIKK